MSRNYYDDDTCVCDLLAFVETKQMNIKYYLQHQKVNCNILKSKILNINYFRNDK